MQKSDQVSLEQFYKEMIEQKGSILVDMDIIRYRMEYLSINKTELKRQLCLKGKQLRDQEPINYQQMIDLLEIDQEQFEHMKQKLLTYDMQLLDDPEIDTDTDKLIRVTNEIASKIPLDSTTFKWQVFKQDDKKDATAIQRVFPRGSLFGLGTQSSGQVLLKNVKIQFASAPAHFAEEKEKKSAALNDKISHTEDIRSTLSFADFKSRMQITLVSDIWREGMNLQQSELVSNMKVLTLLRAILVKQAQNTLKIKSQHIQQSGFIGERSQKVRDEQGEELDPYMVLKFQAFLNLSSLSGKSFDQPVQMFVVKDQQNVQFEPINYSDKTVQDFCQMIKGQQVDMVVVIDGCAARRVGKVCHFTPKLKIHQIILKGISQPKLQQVGFKIPIQMIQQQQDHTTDDSVNSIDEQQYM